jgi:hypothetical protein
MSRRYEVKAGYTGSRNEQRETLLARLAKQTNCVSAAAEQRRAGKLHLSYIFRSKESANKFVERISQNYPDIRTNVSQVQV